MTLDLKPHAENSSVHIATIQGRMQLGGELRGVEDKVAAAVKNGAHKMVLDMSGVEMLDSAALGTLFAIISMLREAGGDGVIASPSKRVMEVFKIVHADQVLRIVPDVASAVTALS